MRMIEMCKFRRRRNVRKRRRKRQGRRPTRLKLQNMVGGMTCKLT
jgi:hypothetical protein